MTPGLHVLKLKPVTGCLRTWPVLLPQLNLNRRRSQTRRKFCTRSSLGFLPRRCYPQQGKQAEAWMLEEWSMKASPLLLDLFTKSFAPMRASKSSRLF
ncbi:MAG TPA: hypothetical protein VLA84_10380 [Microcoleus sp.]|nr:hypothetical protein [Microcoleus sp.]